MRLYLSSFRLGNQPDKLVNLLHDKKRAAVIFNACDLYPIDERQKRLEQEMAALAAVGIEATELDLRSYFVRDGQDALRTALSKIDLLWVRGGNPFVLRRAMASSGLDAVLPPLLASDAIVYGGYSAGVEVLTPSLHGIELVDNPLSVPEGYQSAVIWDCLGIIPYFIAPHYKSDHPASSAIDRKVQYFIDNHMLFKALRDGEAILVNGAEEEILS